MNADDTDSLTGQSPKPSGTSGRASRKKRGARSPRHIAMDLLARRDHTRQELRDKISSKLKAYLAANPPKTFDIDAEPLAEQTISAEDIASELSNEIETVLDELVSDGLLNEARYAESFVNSRIRRGQGPARIRRELSQKGIPDDLADQAFGEVEADWLRQAKEVREKKFGSALPADFKERARQARFLQYRGFTGGQIQRVLGGNDD